MPIYQQNCQTDGLCRCCHESFKVFFGYFSNDVKSPVFSPPPPWTPRIHHDFYGWSLFLYFKINNFNYYHNRQIIGLAKIAAFCKDQNLFEHRQKEIREQCLKFWKVPDELRRAPFMDRPQVPSSTYTIFIYVCSGVIKCDTTLVIEAIGVECQMVRQSYFQDGE